jgi:hypothetical protein
LYDILDILIKSGNAKQASLWLDRYQDIVEKDMKLKTQKITLLLNAEKKREVQSMIDESMENYLIETNPRLYVKVMEYLGAREKVERQLTKMLLPALRNGSSRSLMAVGETFYSMGKAEEFRERISGRLPEAEMIIRELDSRFDRRHLRRNISTY